jgi:hypothetical protein
MTIVKNLNHLNLNTGEKTGIDVFFGDWAKVEQLVNRRTELIENLISGLDIEIKWGPGAALLAVLTKSGVTVSVHGVAVNEGTADLLWRIIEGSWLEKSDKCPLIFANSREYPAIEELKLPWVISLFTTVWHELKEEVRAKAYHQSKIVIGAVYGELRKDAGSTS